MENPWDEKESGVTVGELIRQLRMHPDDTPVCFGPHGHFTYYRVEDRGGIAQIEFNEHDYTLGESHPFQQYLRENRD